MAKYVNEEIARQAAKEGTLVGRTRPSQETKNTWFEVFRHEGKLIACVMAGDIVCGEEITEQELPLYKD